MTIAQLVDDQIARIVNEESTPVSLTRLFSIHRPVRIDVLPHDEISFVYEDGSICPTLLQDDEEYEEIIRLQQLLSATPRYVSF